MNRNRMAWGFVSFLVLITTVVSFGDLRNPAPDGRQSPTPTPENKDTRDLSKYGMVDYSSEVPSTPDRFLVNRRYDKQGWVAPTVYPEVGGVGRVTDEEPPISLPIQESTVIVVGEIVKAVAYLSNDKQGVYTEFTIRVHETLKSSETIARGKNLVADRDGGVVIYPGGQRVFYQDAQIHLPLLGNTYLMFLTRDDSPNFRILTAYELKDGKVKQMEYRPKSDELQKKPDKEFLQFVKKRVKAVDY